MDSARWNHNIQYHPVILRAVPPGCQVALDVGCGDGLLTRQLRSVVRQVVGIDTHRPSLELARGHPGRRDVQYVLGDFLAHPFEPASFDLIACVASLHHMDTGDAVDRMVRLLRPGGVMAVIGVARPRYPADLVYDLAGSLAHRVTRVTRPYWQHPSPTRWPPLETYARIRDLTSRLLPDARYRRRPFFRYSLVWTKPA